jgi:hypothetical protein
MPRGCKKFIFTYSDLSKYIGIPENTIRAELAYYKGKNGNRKMNLKHLDHFVKYVISRKFKYDMLK